VVAKVVAGLMPKTAAWILRWCRVKGSAFRRARPSAAALVWLVTCSAASGQTGPGGADSYTLMIEAICRQYAAAVTGVPPDRMFAQWHGRTELPDISGLSQLSLRTARADAN